MHSHAVGGRVVKGEIAADVNSLVSGIIVLLVQLFCFDKIVPSFSDVHDCRA